MGRAISLSFSDSNTFGAKVKIAKYGVTTRI
jgi:hypothetical protein